jgi:hypothetical protein
VKEEEIDFWRDAQDQRLRPNKWGTRIDNLPGKGNVDDLNNMSEILQRPENGAWKREIKYEAQEVRDYL